MKHGYLGAVEEAQSKRFANQPNYLKNVHVNRFVDPVIKGVISKDEEALVIPHDTLYRFCFVEKNRVDSFSIIAAHAPANQAELISSLFCLLNVHEFIGLLFIYV